MFVGIDISPVNPSKGGGVAFDELSLFANGETGFLFDYTRIASTFQDTAGTTPADDDGEPIGLVVGRVASINGTQTGSARPLRKSGGFARFDGVDDCHSTSANVPVASGFLAARVQAVANSSKVIMGARTSSTLGSAWMNTSTSGKLAGNVGDQAGSGTFVSTTSVTGRWATLGLGWSGGKFRFYVDGALDSADFSFAGGPAALACLCGGLNQNGTPGFFSAVDAKFFLQINRELTVPEFLNLHTKWSAA